MYAVVAPGFSSVYTNWKDVERIHALYPYCKWCKCRNEKDAQEFIKRNTNNHVVKQLYNYGDTLRDLYIDAIYKIGPDCVYYVFYCQRVGNIRLHNDVALIEYKGSKIYAKIPDIYLSPDSIAGHMSAIHNMLLLLGDYVDVNITLPNFSIYYALTSYSRGNSRAITVTRDLIDRRLCNVAYTLKMRNFADNLEAL